MVTPLLPTAEHVLEVGIRRAIGLIRAGEAEAAERALVIAGYAAILIQVDRKAVEA